MDEGVKTGKKRAAVCLVAGAAGCFLSLLAVRVVNRFAIASLSLPVRMVVLPAAYWLIALIPMILAAVCKDQVAGYGFSGDQPMLQIGAGIAVGVGMSLVLTLIPRLLGLGAYIGGKPYQYFWQFAYEFFYCTAAVAAVEELVFRGFFYQKFCLLFEKDTAAVVGSSVLFGAFHLLNGGPVQALATTLLGVFFCLCRKKIKRCTTLSLIFAHGVYDALITVWGYVFAA